MRLSTLLPAVLAPMVLASASRPLEARFVSPRADENALSSPALDVASVQAPDKTKRMAMTTCPPQVMDPKITLCPAGVPAAAIDTTGHLIPYEKTSREHQKPGIGMTPPTLGPDPGSMTSLAVMTFLILFMGGSMLMISLRDEETWDRQYNVEE